MATTNNPRGVDEELGHIITKLFANDHGLKSSLKANQITTRMGLHDALKKADVMKRVRWNLRSERSELSSVVYDTIGFSLV